MSFDAIIKALREGANVRCAMAADDRARAAELAARAGKHTDVAQCFDLLADALATGRLTKDQLRAIVTGANADSEPIDPFDAYTDAQLRGADCISCGGPIEEGWGRSVTEGPRGPLRTHLNTDDCDATDAKGRAL